MSKNDQLAQCIANNENKQSHRFPWSYHYSWPSDVTYKRDCRGECEKDYFGNHMFFFKISTLDLFQLCEQRKIKITNLAPIELTTCITPTPLIMACLVNDAEQVEQILKDLIEQFKSLQRSDSSFIFPRETGLREAFSLAIDQNHSECLETLVSVVEKEQQNEGPVKIISELFASHHLHLLELAIRLNKQEAFNILSQLELKFNNYFYYSHDNLVQNKEQLIDNYIKNLCGMREEGSLIGGGDDEEFEEWMRKIESYSDCVKANIIWNQHGLFLNCKNSSQYYLEGLPFLNQERKNNGWHLSKGIFAKQDAYDGKAISEQFNTAIRTNNSTLISELIDKLEEEQFHYTGSQRCDLAQRHLSWINSAKKDGMTDICFRLILLRIRPDCSCKKRWVYPYTKEKLAQDPDFFIPEGKTIEEKEEKIEQLTRETAEIQQKIARLQQQLTIKQGLKIEDLIDDAKKCVGSLLITKERLFQLLRLFIPQLRLTMKY